MLTNFQFVQKIANQLIRPRPSNYAALDIWQHISKSENYQYDCTKFKINEQRTMNLHMIKRKNDENTDCDQLSTCIVYLHGFTSFCAEGNFLVQNLQNQFQNSNVSVCLFDMRGHGKDKAKNITFGLQESKQLCKLLNNLDEILIYLKKERKFDNFILWGRSMGATTILKMLNDNKEKIDSENIIIKHLVLDSGFCSFERVARQLISRKSGMPILFSKPIFQCLLSSIEKQHKIKLVVELDKLTEIDIPAIFLYSQNDDMVLAEHTKFMYENYSGKKGKMSLNVGHNEQRPLYILKEIFSLLRRVVKQSAKLRKRSVSCKKMGLEVTKNNKKITTIHDFLDQKEQIPVSLQNKFKQLVKSPKQKQNKMKKLSGIIHPHKQNQNFQINQNSIKLSPKPIKTSKFDAEYVKKTQQKNQKDNFEIIDDEKQNMNTVNVKKNQPKIQKDQKLKLSHHNLFKDQTNKVSNLSSNNLDNFETKKIQKQLSFSKFTSPYQLNQDFPNQPTSIFMARNQQNEKTVLKMTKSVIKEEQFTRKDTPKNDISHILVYKKLSTFQKESKYHTIDIKKSQIKIEKPQTEKIHHLKSKTHLLNVNRVIETHHKKYTNFQQPKGFVESNIRNRIDSELSKDILKKSTIVFNYNNLSTLNYKYNQYKVDSQLNKKLYTSSAQHSRYLSNKTYL